MQPPSPPPALWLAPSNPIQSIPSPPALPPRLPAPAPLLCGTGHQALAHQASRPNPAGAAGAVHPPGPRQCRRARRVLPGGVQPLLRHHDADVVSRRAPAREAAREDRRAVRARAEPEVHARKPRHQRVCAPRRSSRMGSRAVLGVRPRTRGGGGGMKFVSLKWASHFWFSIQNFTFPERKTFLVFFGAVLWPGGGRGPPDQPPRPPPPRRESAHT